MKQDASEAGFTLVEVLVSLALLSILSVYALSAIRLQREMNHMQADIARKLEVRAAFYAMQSQLQGMQLVFMPGQDQQFNLVFEGHADRVTFVGLSDGSRIEGGLYRMTFLVDENHTLVGQFEPIKSEGFAPAASIELLDHVASLTFSYAASGTNAEPTAEWLKADQLPKKIEFELALESDTVFGAPSKQMAKQAIVQLAN
jgi:prepilin-type N-terminal cleavage/methylation domain-containing protein